MKAITVSQPFASLIASGEKWVENRGRYTDYRGELAIHAGKGTQYLKGEALAKYATGVVLCRVELVACMELKEIQHWAKLRPKVLAPGTEKYWSEIARHQHAEGPWCLVLQNVRRYREPIPARGQQAVPWEWDEPDLVEFEG